MQRITCSFVCATLLFLSCDTSIAWSQTDEPVFSGPQVGEKLPAFEMRSVLGDRAGKNVDLVAEAHGKSIVLIFVHEVTRPSIGFTRTLATYAHERKKDGLVTGIVFLSDDATAAENRIKNMKHALPPDVPVGVSLEGQEGPGSYGLNRNVALTIVVGKDAKVTANFALIQPSLQADLPKVLQKVVDLVGGKVPKLAELPGMESAMRGPASADTNTALPDLLRRFIRKNATPEETDKAARAIEEYVAKNKQAATELGRIAKTIVDNGKLPQYGNERAREILPTWARKYAAESDKP